MTDFKVLADILLVADVDGTLLTDDKRVLGIDKAAILELQNNGGLFTIATGRGVPYARSLANELGLNIPAVVYNGAAVFDFNKDDFLWQRELPDTASELVLHIRERFPTLGIEIQRESEFYVFATNPRVEEHISYSSTIPIKCLSGELPPRGWLKVLLADEQDAIDEVICFTDGLDTHDMHLVRSAPIYYEILPKNVNKGNAMKKLIEITGIRERRIVAVGDYINDLELLEMADIKVTVANAADAVKEQADLIVCDNNSGAISEIVSWLKKQDKRA